MPAGYGRNIAGSGGSRGGSGNPGPRNPAVTGKVETPRNRFWGAVLKNRLRRNKKVTRGLIQAAGPLKRIATTRGLYR